ncbi:hypothetical protein AZZ66_004673, partial [Escherichia coli]
NEFCTAYAGTTKTQAGQISSGK